MKKCLSLFFFLTQANYSVDTKVTTTAQYVLLAACGKRMANRKEEFETKGGKCRREISADIDSEEYEGPLIQYHETFS